MINLLLFVMTISMIGFSVLSFIKINSYYGITSLSFPVGASVITLYCWGLSIFEVDYSFTVIYVPLIVGSLLLIIVNRYILKNNFFYKIKKSVLFRNKREIFLYIFVLFIVLVEFIAILSHSISVKVYQPDEYSQWAFQAKVIFEGKSLESFYGGNGFETGFERYPSFIPLIAACFYIFSNDIVDSFVRVIGPIFLGSLSIFIYSIIVKIVKSHLIAILMVGIFLTSGFVVFEISSGLYADIAFSYFYTISAVFLLYHLVNKKVRSLLCSALFLGIASWVKTDGQYLIIIHLFILLVHMFLEYRSIKLIRNVKNVLIYLGGASIIPLTWNAYTNISNFPVSRWSFSPHFEFVFSMISSSIEQIMNTTNWGMFWPLCLCMLVINLYLGFRKYQIYVLAIILANIAFLYLSYIFMFGMEAQTAASFSRYILRVAPLSLIYVALIIKELKNTRALRGSGNEGTSNSPGL
ncbi:hypothetical protein [Paenibacillus sp. MAEPY1]|nr:hypothetical protein [Paenibacillus sp. MAEPY1]KGP78073.1 hypothetical protein P363_0132625 [Paenibacillus sp. MAEPY1]